MKNKKWIDIFAIVFLVFAVITGMKLHCQVHHLLIYDNTGLWVAHIVSGLIVALALASHCIQHKS